MKKLLIFTLVIVSSYTSMSQDYVKYESNNKVGFKNKDGKIMIPAKFNAAWDKFSGGLVGVHNGKKWGYVDSTGKLIIPYLYDEVTEFFNGRAIVYMKVNKNDEEPKMGCIDNKGKVIVPIIYYDLIYNNGTGHYFSPINTFLVSGETGSGVLSYFGNIRIPLIYSIKAYIHQGISSFFIVKKNDKYGTIDDMGKIIIPINFDLIEDDEYGVVTGIWRLKVKLDGKASYMDYSGKEL